MRDVPAMEWGGRRPCRAGGAGGCGHGEREVRAAPAKPSAAGSPAAPRGKGPGRLAGRRREGAGRPAGRSRKGAAEEAGGRGHGEREVREGEARRKRAKLSFYLTSQLKMSSLLDVVCGRLNDPFAVCWEQIRVWRCALHKIMFSQCPVDKFPVWY